MNKIRLLIALFLFTCCINASLLAQVSIKTGRTKVVYIFDIKKEIAPPVVRSTQKAFRDAVQLNADIILIYLNTYGGLLDAADSIRTMILRSKKPVYVFINHNAASAGALISLACDSIYMSPGANIGAATVVDQEGRPLPDKYQSYMRSLMRSTAEVNGRNPQIAQAMVDPRIKIPGVTDSGQVVTFTTSEAIKNNFCEGEASSVDEVLKLAGISNYKIIKQHLSLIDRLIGFLINPFVSGILIMLIIGGIYFELQIPGIGFALLVAIVGALLYFAPLYLEGLATHWEILIFIGGLILLCLEIFVIPGFGVAGISGIALIIAGLTLSMVGNRGFDFTQFSILTLIKPVFIVVIALFLSILGSILLSKKIFTNNTRLKSLALNTIQKKEMGFSVSDPQKINLIGKTGTAKTILRPSGKIEVEGDVYDASAEISYIESGEKIIVIKYESAQLFVRKL
ncbi:MAG: ATP-dependent Clp protease proteolytic subunit [Lentimicrobiaceae bacterium]|nr:ATP-dependent Clp protease proteolytic subunit [Lentimicrobiaceae bacterium]